MKGKLTVWMSPVFKGLVALVLVASAIMKITHTPRMMVDGLVRAGLPESAILPIALLELTCLVLYLIPRTMVLGAVLLTGYFGGAMVVHIISKESVFPLILIGFWIWGGIYYSVPGLLSLLPLRRDLAGGVATRDEIRPGSRAAAS